MGFLVPNAQELEVLQSVISTGWTIRLYGNNKTPAGGDVTANYTEIAGGGYAAQPIVSASWTIDTTTNSFPVASYSTPFIWIFTGAINVPGTIYGYYMTRNTDGKLMLAERFSSALVPFSPVAGSKVAVVGRYSVVSQF